MKLRSTFLSLVLCSVSALVVSCAGTRTWDVSTKPEFQGVAGRTFELLFPCYVLKAGDRRLLQPPGNHSGYVFPEKDMDRYIGHSLWSYKVMGVLPAGTKLTVKRVCYVETFSNRWFGVFAVPEQGGEEADLFFLLQSRMDPVSYLDVPSADPRYLREVVP